MPAHRYIRPIDPEVAAAYDRLDENSQEFYQERAAIREFVHGQPRSDAERQALDDVRDFWESWSKAPKV